MLLVGSGAKFVQQLEQAGALAIFVTPEGGSEGHYLRRLRGAGYEVVTLSSKGIGDLASYLTCTHGVRPATLGKSERRTYFFPALIEQYRATLPPKAKGLVFWFYEGHVFSQQELSYLVKLSREDRGVKFVVELGRERSIRWQPLQSA
ncbi:MAG TPA: NAD(P)H-quinone oxidoreductase subunit N [Synechococcus sp. M44_DOE_062]|nr:NAD(P)H-quinone oxidoreductase subunit N [Synechococcus sp. M44_DOE_062]